MAHVGASILRIGFWGILFNNYNKEPPINNPKPQTVNPKPSRLRGYAVWDPELSIEKRRFGSRAVKGVRP